MAIDISKGEDTILKVTPRVIAAIVACIIGFYVWLFMTFVTQTEASEYTNQLRDHITEVSLYRINTDIDNNQDKLWLLRESMNEAGGNTSDRRKKADEYKRRIEHLKEQKDCIHDGGRNC